MGPVSGNTPGREESELDAMSVWPPAVQAGQDGGGEKYFYQNNEFFRTNEGDKAIREILHLLEEKDQTYPVPGDERPVTGEQYLQSAILCASLLAIILILAILV